MKVGETFTQPESSFLVLEKDFARIVDKMLQNPRLLKLLYYREADAMKRPNLTTEQKMKLIDREIRIVPYLNIMKECPISVVIVANNFFPNQTNPQFRDYTINCVIQIIGTQEIFSYGHIKLLVNLMPCLIIKR